MLLLLPGYAPENTVNAQADSKKIKTQAPRS